MVAASRQTISYLGRRFSEVGFRPSSRHGQNFLIDLNLVELLARTADIQAHDVVLEIGTGMGSLTGYLAAQAAAVVTVEVDRHLSQLAQEELERFSNIRFLQQDALRNKNNLHPAVIEAVESALAEGPDRVLKLAANLPYCIATPVISNLLQTRARPISMTATIQRELAERLLAKPATKDYSALSVWVQSQCETELIRILPPSVFWPRPKVESAIVQIRPTAERTGRLADPAFFHQFVRGLFCHRRKFLRSVLVQMFKEQLSKSAVDQILSSQSLGPQARAEELSVEALIALSDAFRTELPQSNLE